MTVNGQQCFRHDSMFVNGTRAPICPWSRDKSLQVATQLDRIETILCVYHVISCMCVNVYMFSICHVDVRLMRTYICLCMCILVYTYRCRFMQVDVSHMYMLVSSYHYFGVWPRSTGHFFEL